ncbi:MAG: ABC transporter transmembrane domain-containing protein, partial [Anaerolineae bacterium]
MNIPLKQYGQLLARYLKPQRPQVALLAALLFGSIGLQLVNPQVIRYFIDTAHSGGAQPTLLLAAGLFIAFSVAQRGVALGADTLAQTVGWRATNALRKDLMRHCLRLDMSFHKTHTPGELIERIDGARVHRAGVADHDAGFEARIAVGVYLRVQRVDVDLECCIDGNHAIAGGADAEQLDGLLHRRMRF